MFVLWCLEKLEMIATYRYAWSKNGTKVLERIITENTKDIAMTLIDS